MVNIIDKNSGDSVGTIENTTGVHGIAFDVAAGKGYCSNGRLNNVYVFDIATGKILATIPTGKTLMQLSTNHSLKRSLPVMAAAITFL